MSRFTATAPSPARSRIDSYAKVAAEYYDSVRHPTCANFREASAAILEPWLRSYVKPGELILETGAGDSLVAELVERLAPTVSLILSDRSAGMLRHTSDCVKWPRLLADASALPIRNESVDTVVASLADPYNTASFWRESARVLKPGGKVFFTTPSFDWARSFRDETGAPLAAAEFLLGTGEVILVPSFVFSDEHQANLIRSSGLRLEAVLQIDDQAIRQTARSQKLRNGNVVTGFLAVR